MRALPEQWRERCALTNAHDRDGTTHDLRNAHAALGRPAVVALGQLARRQLASQDVAHAAAPHPQWWRRFRHQDVDQYRESLLTAAAEATTESGRVACV